MSLLRHQFGHGILAGLAVSVACTLVLNFIPFQANAINDTILSGKQLDAVKKDLGDTTKSIESLSSEYHSSVNSIMNGYMKAFFMQQSASTNGTSGTANKSPNVAPPKTDTECNDLSAKMNVSTYCLFVQVDRLYQIYISTLRSKQDTSLQEIQDIANNTQVTSSNFYAARGEWINRELTSTQKALDSGLQAYSELLLQYPMHLEYQKTIKDLVKYYDGLADMRKNVDTYPARFQDVTTTQCDKP